MKSDKKHRKKLQRKKKRAELKKKKIGAIRRDKYRDLFYFMDSAYAYSEYQEAFKYAMAILEMSPKDENAFSIAMESSLALDDKSMVFTVLTHGWRHGFIKDKEKLVILIEMAIDTGHLNLAREITYNLVSNPTAYEGNLSSRSKAVLESIINYFSNEDAEKSRQRAAGTKKSKTGQTRHKDQAKKRGKEQAGTSPAKTENRHENKTDKARKDKTSQVPVPGLEVKVEAETGAFLNIVGSARAATRELFDLTLDAYRIARESTYDELICLPRLNGVDALWYQQETARKVMKQFRGRAILADEVGLGKTIEACLVLKEYMTRGLVKTALVLVPSSLVNQWKGELEDKFGLVFASTNDDSFRKDPEKFWDSPLVLASIQTAKSKRHFASVTRRAYDMVIVDEAHHLKNHTSLNWKLVNSLQKTYLLLLTATPVQNKLEELYNLVTLLKPGHLHTRKAFKEQFVARGNPTDPVNREKLRGLLREVMIRNTRSVAKVMLPPRFASTVKVEPDPVEAEFYENISAFVQSQAAREQNTLAKMRLKRLLEGAGSSHAAVAAMLERLAAAGGDVAKDAAVLLDQTRRLKKNAKARQVAQIIKACGDQVVVFVNYKATLDYLHDYFLKKNIDHVVFQGGMTNVQKKKAIDEFRSGTRVLLATGSGGEGHNLQFCHTLINYDLPWNPMEIEQRIGRLHRIGQKKPVQVYNFCTSGSIEERILEVLDRKINMFELVVGEIDMILGRLRGEKEFADLIFELWVGNTDDRSRDKAFDTLATRLKRARSAYDQTKNLDEKLFKEDFGI